MEDLIKTEPMDELPPPPAYRPRQPPSATATSAQTEAAEAAGVEDEDMEPVISMVFEHFKKDIEAACSELRIASGNSTTAFLMCCIRIILLLTQAQYGNLEHIVYVANAIFSTVDALLGSW